MQHPLLEQREQISNVRVLVLSSNRGLCGGYNASILRTAIPTIQGLREEGKTTAIDVSGKRGINGLGFRGIECDQNYLQFEDQPAYDEVEAIADDYLSQYITKKIDRLDVVYTKFISTSRQEAVVETLLPLGSLGEEDTVADSEGNAEYEFLPSAESILEEVVPTSFKVKLFKCFLDAAVSEQVARMIAMKGANGKCRRHDQATFDDLQPSSPESDYGRDHGDHRRRRSA